MPRVLIVDDSPTETYAFQAMLEKHNYEVLTADNGADGVALARQELPDVVLMDIVMPGLNGFQATRQLTKEPIPRISRWSLLLQKIRKLIVYGVGARELPVIWLSLLPKPS